MAHLVLVRHGQSEWNRKNLFTGWTDVALTDTGREEARAIALLLTGMSFDHAFSSDLMRAKETLDIILGELGQLGIPTYAHKALRERDYGELTGMNKEEVRALHGDEFFHNFRRGFETRPPGGESLRDTTARTVPYFESEIRSMLVNGKNVIVAAHGNSIRALVKHLEKISDEAIAHVEIGTGAARLYSIDTKGTITASEIRDHRTS